VSAKVYFFPHPFTDERREASIESGVTLASIVKNARSDIPRGLMVRTFVNGTLVSADKRQNTVLKDGDEIIVRIVPANSGDGTRQEAAQGKGVLGGIATIAGIAFAVVAGIVTGGLSWIAVGMIAAGVGLVVTSGLTASGVIGGPYADEMGTKNHPSIRGASNQSDPNGKVPLVLGRHLLTPGYLCPPYTVISGTDGKDQYLYMAFVLGYAPLSVSNIKLGDFLVASNSANTTEGAIAVDGVLPGCEVELRQSGAAISFFEKEVIEQNFQTLLSRYHVLSGLSLTVDASARTITRSSGDWTDSDNDVQVGDYVDFYGFSNDGNNKQFLVTGISSTVIYCALASTLVNETKSDVGVIVVPATLQTTAQNTTQIAVTITFPKLVKYNTDDKLYTTVVVKPYYRLKAAAGSPPNPWTLLGTFDSGSNSITRNKAETLRFTATSGTLTAGQYEVFVMRETEDADDTKIVDQVYWTSLRSHTGIDIMPQAYREKVAILGVKVKASEAVQNCITKLNCIVAADYSYIATEDTSHDWASIIASNPRNAALAFVHAIMGPGNPRPRPTSQMDWASIYAFAQWCDTAKGTGDNAYKIEINGLITSSMKLSELIVKILSQARASLTMSEGKYGVVYDVAQSTPKQHIGPHNSWGFQGKKVFGEEIHGYRVKFINADEEYTTDERIVLDDGYKYDTEADGVLRDCWGVDKTADAGYIEATKFETIEAGLNTNPAQVFGWCRYLLAVRKLRPELFTVNMDAENLAVRRGELVKVTHPAPRWGLADGRLSGITVDGEGNITAVETDNMLTMEAGKAYAIRIRTAAGTSVYRTVVLDVGDTHELTLSTPISAGADIPAEGDWFAFGIDELETVDCIVAGIDLNDDLSAKLTLFEAAPAVHTADMGAIPDFTSKVSFGPNPSAPSTKPSVFPPAPDVIPYPSEKALSTLSDTVDFDGQYGIYNGQRYIGTTPDTWTLNDAGQTAADVAALIPIYEPAYLGAHLDGTPSTAKNGDSYLRYSPTSGDENRGVFTYDGTTWTRTTDPIYVYKALVDIVFVCQLKDQDGAALYGAEADYGIDSSMQTAHIMSAIIDRLRVGDLEIFGTLKSLLMDTINSQAGETINAPTPTYWPGSELIDLCSTLADGWHAVDSASAFDGKNITHVVKGGSDNTVSYQASDVEATGPGTLKTITSAVSGKTTLYFDIKDTAWFRLHVNGSLYKSYLGTSSYVTQSEKLVLNTGDIISLESSSGYCRNFRLCPAVNTIGLWNNTDNTALSVDNAGYYDEAGTVNVNSGTLTTSSIDDYWPGSELIALFTGKLTAYRTVDLGGGTFNSKTCSTIYQNGSESIIITFTDATTITINAIGYYSYTGSIILDDVEGKILFGDPDSEGQYELWSHNIPGSTDNILTVRNTKSGKVFSIWETRAPDTTAGNDSESTFSLHGVVGSDDYVHDDSMHNYSGDMHFIDGFYNYSGGHVGNWKKVSKRTPTAWAADTIYAINDLRVNSGNVYLCIYGGTSASSGGPTGTGNHIQDNTVYWAYIDGLSDGVLEELLAETNTLEGTLWVAGGRKVTGYLHGTYTEAEMFTAIVPTLRVIGQSIIVSGFAMQGTTIINVNRAMRTSHSGIHLYGFRTSTNAASFLYIEYDSSDSVTASLSW